MAALIKKIKFMLNGNCRIPSQVTKLTGTVQPPKKRKTNNIDMPIILLYSARKKKAKMIEEYSTLNPATSSASASGKSKGARFVSASIVIKKIILKDIKGTQYQILSCAYTISEIFRDPALIITGNIINNIEIS